VNPISGPTTTSSAPTLTSRPPGDAPRAAALAPAVRRSWIADTVTVMTRELRPVVREPFSVVFGLVQPLVFLALFGPLLAGSLGADLGAGVWQWFVPSILVMTTLFGTSTTGSNLQVEMQTGAHERLLVTPLPRSAQLVGRSLKEMVPVIAQGVIVIAVMLPFGFELHGAGVVLGLALLGVLGVGLGSLSYALAIAVRSQEWMFWAVQQTFLFPAMILSGMLLPLDAGPAWMQAAARVNPLSYVVDAERALLAGELASAAVLWGWVAALATAALGLAVGIRTIVRSTD
jgi:ABC-2 type transport system permease protein